MKRMFSRLNQVVTTICLQDADGPTVHQTAALLVTTTVLEELPVWLGECVTCRMLCVYYCRQYTGSPGG